MKTFSSFVTDCHTPVADVLEVLDAERVEPSLTIPAGIVTDLRPVLTNAKLPRVVKDAGRSISVRDVQLKNA